MSSTKHLILKADFKSEIDVLTSFPFSAYSLCCQTLQKEICFRLSSYTVDLYWGGLKASECVCEPT